ncbi:alpha/beta hydrolase [Streptomyces sp. NPDC056161]|uniref:alpha/beta hydrolase n=1 Tax=Streptomyces sp. NPDC056161 TaxID=3345732 RepID=UPI0035DB7C5C
MKTPSAPALLYVPDRLPHWPVPLLVAFHGAGGGPGDMLSLLQPEAQQRKVLLLAPTSYGATWDVLLDGHFGPDAMGLQHAMATVVEHFRVDRDRIAVAGFSDGASYALGLGLANGDLFTRVLAYSPSRIPPGRKDGRPTVFVSHGQRDPILPVSHTSHRIVPALEDDGYHVDYIEHGHGHEVPRPVVTASAELLG